MKRPNTKERIRKALEDSQQLLTNLQNLAGQQPALGVKVTAKIQEIEQRNSLALKFLAP